MTATPLTAGLLVGLFSAPININISDLQASGIDAVGLWGFVEIGQGSTPSAFQPAPLSIDSEIVTSSIDEKFLENSDNFEVLNRQNFVADANKILLNKKDCTPKAGEILVCGNSDIDTRYRIENRRSLEDLPRDHRSWTDGAARLQDNAENNSLGSFNSTGYFGGVSQGIENKRDHCEQGASEAKNKNAQARAIAKISQNQTSATPKPEKGPCEV